MAAARVFRRAVIVALDAIAALWKEDDTEALAVRERLCRHGLAARLVEISLLQGRSGEVAVEILAKMNDDEKNAYVLPDPQSIPCEFSCCEDSQIHATDMGSMH